MESGEGGSGKGEMMARFHGDGIRAEERRKSMMETVGSCRRDAPGKKGRMGVNAQGRKKIRVREAGRKEGQVGPEADPSIQVRKSICTPMSQVTYQNKSKNQMHRLQLFWAPPLSSAFAVSCHS